jgi:transposase
MAGRVLVDDELWVIVEQLIPKVQRRRVRPGRRRLDDRAVLNGILFVLHTGIPWRLLPQELGFGSGVTCWRRLREWQAAGVWECLHEQLLIRLNRAGEINWDRAVVDASHIRALLGGSAPGHPQLTVAARAASTTS